MAESWASSPSSRAVMKANRGRDTRPELALRTEIHRRGLRYRVNVRPIRELPRTADITFPKVKIAVFLDGCFWHGCPEHHRPATGRSSEFWRGKILNNRQRDTETNERLRQAGWDVIRIWEHERPTDAADRVEGLVKLKRLKPLESAAKQPYQG